MFFATRRLNIIGHTTSDSPRRIGAAVLETVLIMPVLLYLAFGVVEFGYYFYVKHAVEGAAREGCRAFIVTGATLTDVSNAVSNSMSAAQLSGSGYTIVTKDGSTTLTNGNYTSAIAGDTITVTVSCTWGTAGAGYRPWGLIGVSKSVIGTAVMRKEG
jgi:Flp pilus assembly protein TadG